MTEAEIIRRMMECQSAATAIKEAKTADKDFEGAARWRDVALALGNAIKHTTLKEQGIKVEMITADDFVRWEDLP